MPEPIVEILDCDEMRRVLTRLASEIVEYHPTNVVLVGIRTRGVPLAHRLAAYIARIEGQAPPVGALDITFYRDDLHRLNLRTPQPSAIPADISDQVVVLVDDVIYSGRTIQAALAALREFGRPHLVRLAVLIDRGHRELPIHPDFVGKTIPTARAESVKVHITEEDAEDRVFLLRR